MWNRRLVALQVVVLCASHPAAAGAPAHAVPIEDYALYDQAVTKKFLTSETRLVVIERMTVPRLSPNQDGPLTVRLFAELNAFDGELPLELARAFVAVNQDPLRLEGRFQFGARYRFVTGTSEEEPEVSLAHPVRAGRRDLVQLSPVLGRLAFSRVGRTFRNDQALLYVEQNRPDGTGAGILVWFRRQGTAWSIFDTDVLWTIRDDLAADDGPALAP
jgi:hypothetical protein